MAIFSRRAALLGMATLAASTLVENTDAQAQTPVAEAPPLGGVKPVPPPGIAIPDADRKTLTEGVAALDKEIAGLRADLHKSHPDLVRFIPDAVIFRNAVYYALTYNEFFNLKEVETAKTLLTMGSDRARQLHDGTAPWTTQTGLQVLGYVSKIDGSVQPWGVLVPDDWKPGEKEKRRLDFFLHGRGDTLSEISYINGRLHGKGEFTPPGAFVLQPYGRFCNANRYAGEMDIFEALADAKTRYAIDDDRIVMRGFSMGGASCWQFATHYADKWVVASPGAGFTDTASYTKAFAPDKPKLPLWEQKLWAWYDPVDYAANLAQCPVVAYSGEIDGQKIAADNMVEAAKKEGLTFPYIIGKAAGHKYTPEAKKEINALIDGYVQKGREKFPRQIKFTTYTLRYNTMNWLTVEGLEKHWERARVDGGLDETGKKIVLKTENVSRLALDPKWSGPYRVVLDGQTVARAEGARVGLFEKINDKWVNIAYAPLEAAEAGQREKRPGLQGPIDDAFCTSFVMVRPTGKPLNEAVGKWVSGEMAHALREWRKMFQGEARVIDDKAVTDADLKNSNLILWGDPQSNAILAKIVAKLPIEWSASGVKAKGKTYPVGSTVPVFVFPNPLNPARYVVINSGHTFREAHYYTNAQQTPKLPDWAIVDITTPADARAPGRIADAGFFDEEWQM